MQGKFIVYYVIKVFQDTNRRSRKVTLDALTVYKFKLEKKLCLDTSKALGAVDVCAKNSELHYTDIESGFVEGFL